MFGTFDAIWRELVAAGAVTADEYLRMTLPQYYNTVAELRAPLEDEEGPVHRAGLRLEHLETRVVGCPFAAAFRRDGDVDAFARSYIPTLRSWSQSTFFGALDPSRPEQERRRIIDDFYGTYAERVRRAPEGHGMDYVHAYMTIARVRAAI